MDDEFYEDDEPIGDVRAAFEAGEKGITVGRPEVKTHETTLVVFDFINGRVAEEDQSSVPGASGAMASRS